MTLERGHLAQLPSTGSAWCFEAFEFDPVGGALWHEGIEIPLRRKTWQLLSLLVANPRKLCAKAELISALWPRAAVVDDSLVQCVVELRRALSDSDRRIVRTVSRVGYRFDADVRACQPQWLRTSAEPTLDARLAGAWRTLARAESSVQVDGARQLFAREAADSNLRADALAGVAMSHVIDVLNRWARCPAWDMAIACEAAEESMALDPRSARACHARANVAMIQGRSVDALLGFRAALRRDPLMSRAWLRMGVIEMEFGHPERTAEHVREALQIAGDDDGVLQAQAFFIQGMASFHLEHESHALACMRRVLKLRPNSGLAHQWLASMDALGGRAERSAVHLEAFHRLVPGHTIESLQATERSHEPMFMRQRNRFYVGLRRAGLS